MANLVNAMLAIGAKIFDSPDNITWSEMADMMSIGKPVQPTINMIAVNSVNPVGRAEQFLPGLVKWNEFEWKQFADQQGVRFAHHYARLSLTGSIITYYKVVLPDAGPSGVPSSVVMTGYLMDAALSELESEKPVTIEGKVKVTGQPVITYAS